MGLQTARRARNHQRFSACRVHTSQRRAAPISSEACPRFLLEIWNGLGVSAHSAAGLSGCAPCRLCRHGHSASIPHAFAPAALRASLASRGKPCGLSPPRELGAPRCRRTGCAGSARPAPRRDGRGAGEHAGACCGRLCGACRPQRWRFLPITSRRTVHGQPARHRYGASTPRLKTGAARCGGGVLACRRVVDLARVRASR
jgi:hypothetical protein